MKTFLCAALLTFFAGTQTTIFAGEETTNNSPEKTPANKAVLAANDFPFFAKRQKNPVIA